MIYIWFADSNILIFWNMFSYETDNLIYCIYFNIYSYEYLCIKWESLPA